MASRSRPKTVSVRWQHIASEAASWALSLVTVAGLAAVGWFGHATHWTFGLAGHAEPHHGAGPAAADHADAEAGGRAEPAAAGDVVRFGSQEDLERSGIEVVPCEERPMVSELVANGVVALRRAPHRAALARVPGSVWRVEKHLGDRVQQGRRAPRYRQPARWGGSRPSSSTPWWPPRPGASSSPSWKR